MLTMINSSEMILQLENQINILNEAGSRKEGIVSALIDTNMKFPVEDRIKAYFIHRKIQFHYVNFNKMHYNQLYEFR